MAIKIDLLPRYVGLQRRFNTLWKVAAGVLLALVAILGIIYLRGETDLRSLRAQLQTAEAEAKLTETALAATKSANDSAAPLETFSQFMVNASATGANRAALIDLVARYVTPGAVVNSIDMSDGNKAVIKATLRTPDDYARFLLGLRSGSATRGGPVFAADPRTSAVVPLDPVKSVDKPLGYGEPPTRPAPTTQAQVVTYPIVMTVEGTLKTPIFIPAEPGAAPAAATGSTSSATPSPTPSPSPAAR